MYGQTNGVLHNNNQDFMIDAPFQQTYQSTIPKTEHMNQQESVDMAIAIAHRIGNCNIYEQQNLNGDSCDLKMYNVESGDLNIDSAELRGIRDDFHNGVDNNNFNISNCNGHDYNLTQNNLNNFSSNNKKDHSTNNLMNYGNNVTYNSNMNIHSGMLSNNCNGNLNHLSNGTRHDKSKRIKSTNICGNADNNHPGI